MPISIVVGGQFGSEGKGKVAHEIARTRHARAVVRVGGPNSGHTVVDRGGKTWIFRQLPTAAILQSAVCVIAAGSYVDVEILRAEINSLGLGPERLKIDPKAVLIEPEAKEDEKSLGLRERIGSTLTGTGAAVSRRVNRAPTIRWVTQASELAPYISDTAEYLSKAISAGDRVVAEGTQGFGLSLIHTPYFPFATSRDTTAAGVLSEIGLSPLMVDEVAMVIRAFPIRVPGNSGPLPSEITWAELTKRAGSKEILEEFTSVTKARRRVAEFDPFIVKRAIAANAPTSIYLNHVDYVDAECRKMGRLTQRAVRFVGEVERAIEQQISYAGVGPVSLVARNVWTTVAAVA